MLNRSLHFLGLTADLLGLRISRALQAGTPIRHAYQTVKPITEKNIGRNYLKSTSRYMPHQGAQEMARRVRQANKKELSA